MPNLQETLRNETLKLEQSNTREREEQEKLDAVVSALTETTALDNSKVAAVLRNVRDEATELASKPTLPLVKLPPVSSQKLRIGIYLIIGFMGYSFYKSAQVNTLQEEQYLSDYQQPKVELQLGVVSLQGLLSDPFRSFYEQNSRFPQSIKDLDDVYQTARHLENSRFFGAYKMLESGSIRVEMTEFYGYNRWLELTPTLIDHPLWVVIDFHCRSNMESHLLHNNGRNWCEHSPG